MLFVAYDISDNKTRAKFCKFLKKFGRHLQYSLFEISYSKRVLDKIVTEINLKFKPKFKITDSVLIWDLTENEEQRVLRYGYAVHEEEDLIIFN